MLSGAYRFPQMESVIFGRPYVEAVASEVHRLDARAVFVIASGTLACETDLIERGAAIFVESSHWLVVELGNSRQLRQA